MKTTSGKTKAPRRPARPVDIFNEFGSKVATRNVSSLRQALLEYYKEKLKPLGYDQHIVNGNVLTISNHENTHMFVAKDQRSLETRDLKL